jgi:hypothetical protein
MPAITWLDGAERVAGAQAGGTMVGGPPRVVHHITADALDPRPSFDGVRDYLVRAGFEPHLLVDPFTGRIAQFLPFTRSAYALMHTAGTAETNRQGSACIQVEWYFSRGLTVGGKTYASLADTPMHGLAQVLTVARSWGVLDAWPAGKPQWSGSPRDLGTWLRRSGHYGHCHVPGNDHIDPGPFVDLPPVHRALSDHEKHLVYLEAQNPAALTLRNKHDLAVMRQQGLI